jgi:RNA polymerase sigma factor (sigma-70 family)
VTEPAPALDRLQATVAHAPAAEIERFGGALRPWLTALTRYVRREMAFLRARGDLEGDFPTADDVVDETLARAWRELRMRPDAAVAKPWLYRIAHSVLAQAVRARRRRHGRFVSLEKRLPEALALEEAIDEAIYDYWQPDQALKFEDIVADDSNNPEEVASRAELRSVLAQLLAELPDGWRQAVLLTQVEDLSRAEAARHLHIREDQLARWVEQADAFLKARLSELGISASDLRDAGRPGAAAAAGTRPPEALVRAFDHACGEAGAAGRTGRPP